jgi:hypothetical protein
LPNVQMPDGSVVNLPDNPSPVQKLAVQAKMQLLDLRKKRDEITAQQKPLFDRYFSQPMGKRFNSPPDQAPIEALDEEIRLKESELSRHTADMGGLLDKALHYGKQGLSSIGRGLLSVAAMAAEAGNMDRASMGRGFEPGSATKDASRVGMAPTTQAERYINAGLEGASGSLLGGGGLAARLATGAAANLGSEGAATALGDNPLARALGSVAGGTAGGLSSMAKTSRGSVVKAATQGVSESELRLAKALQQKALEVSPVGLNTAQALGRSSPLDVAVSNVANSPQGLMVRAQLQAQPAAVQGVATKLIDVLPGRSVSTTQASDGLQSAATDAIKGVKSQRSQLWKSVFDANDNGVKNIDIDIHKRVQDKLYALISDTPNTPKGAFLNDLNKKLNMPNGDPITNAAKLNDILLAKSHELKQPTLGTPGFDAGSAKWLNSKIQEIRQDMGDAFHPYRMANKAYAEFTDAAVSPAKKGIVGQIAKNGAMDDKAAAIAPMLRVFDQGTTPGVNRSDILKLEHGLRSTPNGADSFQTAFKTWAAGKLDAASKSDSNRQADGVAAALSKSFGAMDAPTSAGQGFKDSLVAVARSKGLPDQSLVRGWKHAMEFVSASAVRPGSGVSSSSIRKAAQGETARYSASGSTPIISEVRSLISNLRGRDAYSFLDRLLTTPEGTETLIRLSNSSSLGKSAETALATLLGGTRVAQSKEGN